MVRLKVILYLFLIELSIIFVGAATGDRSKKKCEEYGKLVYTEEFSPVLSRRSSKDKVSQCGIVEIPLVIGGIAAKPKEFPHMALIGYGKSPTDPDISWKCGASLISEKFVLSASHCMTSQRTNPQVVRLGEVDIDNVEESKIQDRKILRIIKHPKHTNGKKYNDIALLELETPVKFDAYVRPACLQGDQNFSDTRVLAAGFGKTSFDNMDGSKELMKVTLNLLSSKTCENYFKKEISPSGSLSDGITNNQLCAGELKGGKDTCQGDSGGPLQIVLSKPYCMYSIVGIVSFGKFCGFPNQPAIYTKVGSYIEWIEDTVWPKSI